MPDLPVIIEAALNGATPKSRNPHVPRTPNEVAVDGVRCLDAGATVVHNHTDDAPFGGSGAHDAAPYIASWRRILDERPHAILYPTMAGIGSSATIEQRFAHQTALADAGLLGMALVDPGSTNIGPADAQGLPQPVDWIYGNTYRDTRYMFAWCERTGTGASISIFEPGFLRVVLAYHAAGRLPPGAFVKLYFGAHQPLSFGLPPTPPALEAYLSMLEGTGLPWLVSAYGGDLVECGLARLALERGGHVQVGLEPYGGERTPTNVDLINEVSDVAAKVGRPIATSAEARRIIGLRALP
ncbi:MAG TPA: 3-keto-5-aminohexanoate cleavage protein [Dehalococcoidia bacterium]|jgi:uncharacterized protein (DUF849 family)